MKPLNEIYKGGFFKQRHKMNWRVNPFCTMVCNTFNPKTLIDVGCATGDLVRGFLDRGVDAIGIDGSDGCLEFLEIPRDRFLLLDLRNPIRVGRWDIALCLEVLEHIEPEYADVLVQNLVEMSDKLLISAAPPGQGGHYHVNCQPREYWSEKFEGYGFDFRPRWTTSMKKTLKPWAAKPGIKAYYQNLLYYQKRM